MYQVIEGLLLGSLLIAPLLVLLAFVLLPSISEVRAAQILSILFSGVALTAMAGAYQASQPFRAEFLWPISGESSGHFNFSLLLQWERLSSIAMFNCILLLMSRASGPPRQNSVYQLGSHWERALLLLSSAVWSLMITVENFSLSILFLEGGLFLGHIWLCLRDVAGRVSEQSAFLKRLYFNLMALVALIAFTLFFRGTPGSVIILASVFYGIGLFLSRKTIQDWPEALIVLALSIGWMTLLSRALIEAGMGEYYFYLGLALGAFSLIGFLFSAMAVHWGNSFQWFVFGAAMFSAFFRFTSKPMEVVGWLGHDLVTGAALLGFLISMRLFAFPIGHLLVAAISLLQLVLLLQISVGFPWFEAAGGLGIAQQPIVWSVIILGHFLGALALARGSASVYREEKAEKALTLEDMGYWALAFLVVILIFAKVFSTKAVTGFNILPRDLESFVAIFVVVVGYIFGGFLGLRVRRAGAVSKEARFEDLFPDLNGMQGVFLPAISFGLWKKGNRLENLGSAPFRAMVWLERADRQFFSSLFFNGQRWLMEKWTNLLFSANNGNMQFYFLFSMLVVGLAMVGIFFGSHVPEVK
jgi:hypothetical protein